MPTARQLILATLLFSVLPGLMACGHPPDTRSVQQAVEDAAAGQ